MRISIKTNQNEAINVTFLTFSGGERHIQLAEVSKQPVNSVEVLMRIQSSEAVMDLLLTVNALRQAFGQSLKISLTLPYLPYARQDRVCAAGQAFSLAVFAQLLNGLQLADVTVWDCHSQVGLDLTKAKDVTPEQIIAADQTLSQQLQSSDSVLICPDKGAQARCTAIKNHFGLATMVQCFKKRDPKTGAILATEVMADTLAGKTAIIVDDICDGGYTFIKIAEQLKAKQANKVILYVTHGIFSKGFEVFDGLIDEIYTTNSIERTQTIARLRIINFEENNERNKGTQ